MRKQTIKRALSVDNILNTKYVDLDFDGEWAELLGDPEANGSWIIWGDSGHGKSRFCMMLAKKLTEFGKVAYNSLEEGGRKSIKKNMAACGMDAPEVKKNFLVLNREPIDQLKERLRKKQHPRFVFIDSFQYTGLTKPQYIALIEEFPDILFIFVSHAEGKKPLGSGADFVRYNSDIKIRVEGYKAFPMSRLGGTYEEAFTIWPEGAAKYWVNVK